MTKQDQDLFDYDNLTLVDKPDSPRNAGLVSQTLEGCEGYLKQLPLRGPNVDLQNAPTISDMVNILTKAEAAAAFVEADLNHQGEEREEGKPLASVYDPTASSVMQKYLKATKGHVSHMKAPGILGHIVLPGCISFYTKDGKTFAVTEGRWMLTNPKAQWVSKQISLDQDTIQPPGTQVLIIRVPPGSVGRILDKGTPVLLDVGMHVFNSGVVVNVGTIDYAKNQRIVHGPFNYVRVPRGQFAKVWAEVKMANGVKSVQPRLLEEGEHTIFSHVFQFSGFVDVSDEYISHGSIRRVSVDKGKLAKVWQDNVPRLLGSGEHTVESTNFSFKGTDEIISTPCIVHGTLTILRVTRGLIALAWKDNEPTLIDKPGLYEVDSANFQFVEFKDAEEQFIQLGAKKIVLVHTGQVGVSYDQGTLKILHHGRHLINSATHIFYRFLSTQQKSIRLASLTAGEKIARMSQAGNRQTAKQAYKTNSSSARTSDDLNRYSSVKVDPDADLTICETKDLVKVGLRADVFYSIADPEKCILKIDTDELEDLVRETAVSTLTNIIRSTALNQIAQSKAISAGSEQSVEVLAPPGEEASVPGGAPSSVVFFERVHDEFLYKLHDDFHHRYGVDIANIRIESFKIMDLELAEQISKHALTTAQIENEMANLEGKSMISTTQERTAAEVQSINAQAKAAALKCEADAKNQREIEAAQAAAEAQRIAIRAAAEAEADAILVKARAEAEAVRLKAEAEAQRAELLSKTTLGQQEILLAQYSQMVVESNKGVEKVVYMDPSINRDSPFALGSLQNLNMDLHALSKLGIAASGSNGGTSGKQN